MSIRDYSDCPEWKGFLAAWVADRRLPLPTVDFFLEVGEEELAEALRWIATQPDRPVPSPMTALGERGGSCGLFPTLAGTGYLCPYFSFYNKFAIPSRCNELPWSLKLFVEGQPGVTREGFSGHHVTFRSYEDALLALVDGVVQWRRSEASSPTPNTQSNDKVEVSRD